jgi:hypothetical protein
MVPDMYRYCGKVWSENDIERIRELIAASPLSLRAALARQVCETFNWRRINGQLSAMSCRVAMIRMARDGLIILPAARHVQRRPRTSFVSPRSDPQPPLETAIGALNDLRLELVAPGNALSLWNEFIGRYHYLGYRIMPGAQLRYFIKAEEKILGAMGFGGAAWKVAPRDKFIGWTAEQRESRLHLIVNQTRFLILPWVRCQNLATRSLRLAIKRLPNDWQTRYGYRPALLETFVDVTKFHGTCYKADNWIQVGLTQGRSRMDRYNAKDQPVKSIWLKPLVRNFRDALNAQVLPASVESP